MEEYKTQTTDSLQASPTDYLSLLLQLFTFNNYGHPEVRQNLQAIKWRE